MSHYNGFNYEEFYEFIVDFFEEDHTPEGKAAVNKLFDWWNRYVSDFRFAFAFHVADASVDVCFRGLPLLEPPHLDQQSGHRLQSYDDSVTHAHFTSTPSS